MRNIGNWKRTCQTPALQDEWWDLGRGFFTSFMVDEWSVMRQKQLPFFFFIYLSSSTPLILFPAALGPACMNIDRDRHMQGGQQPCLASASSPWQKISMRADNRTRNENNAVCQPRNPACHSGTFAIPGVFHEHSSTRRLNLKFNSSVPALIPGRFRLQHLCENLDPDKELQQSHVRVGVFFHLNGAIFCSARLLIIIWAWCAKKSIISLFLKPFPQSNSTGHSTFLILTQPVIYAS